jgi:stalled ribosome rescue protein Dom34
MSAAAFHKLVWIDHTAAHVYAFARESMTELASIRARDTGKGHLHHKAGTPGPGHNEIDRPLLEQTADALGGASEILIVGPGQARHALSNFLDTHRPATAQRVVGVEAADRCSDSDLHTLARGFFLRTDRMQRRP